MYHKWNIHLIILLITTINSINLVQHYNTKNPNITNSNFDEYMRISDLFCTYPIFYYHILIYINPLASQYIVLVLKLIGVYIIYKPAAKRFRLGIIQNNKYIDFHFFLFVRKSHTTYIYSTTYIYIYIAYVVYSSYKPLLKQAKNSFFLSFF